MEYSYIHILQIIKTWLHTLHQCPKHRHILLLLVLSVVIQLFKFNFGAGKITA